MLSKKFIEYGKKSCESCRLKKDRQTKRFFVCGLWKFIKKQWKKSDQKGSTENQSKNFLVNYKKTSENILVKKTLIEKILIKLKKTGL